MEQVPKTTVKQEVLNLRKRVRELELQMENAWNKIETLEKTVNNEQKIISTPGTYNTFGKGFGVPDIRSGNVSVSEIMNMHS